MNTDKQSLTPAAYPAQPVYEDEISLVDIVRVLLRRKKIIIGVTVISVLIGFIYAFTQQRVYQVETILLPPSFENIEPLNVLKSSNMTSSKVLASFISNINSRKLRKAFFDRFKILETLTANSDQVVTDKDINGFFESFSKSLKVTEDKQSNSIRITLDGIYKAKIGPWLDNLVAMTNNETVNQLVKNLQSSIDSKIKSLQINIASKRSISKQRRSDELGRLQEALQIAKSLGIRDYNNISSMSSKNNNLSIYTQEKKTYMQGTRVLQAEIKALKNRKSDDIHIKGLRDLQEKLSRIEAIKIRKNKLQAVIVDKKATIGIKPIRPKRKLILILSFVLGGILGIFGVFIMEFSSNFKNELKNDANPDHK